MAYTTGSFSGVSYGTNSGTTVTETGNSPSTVGSLTDNTAGATQLNVGDSVTYNFSTGGGANQTFTGTYVGDYVSNGTGYPVFKNTQNSLYYILGQNGTNGTTYSYAQSSYPPCYVTGTRILTERGEVAVEDLRVGDLAVTASGAQRTIRWVGSRLTDIRRHPCPDEVMPVRIRAGALGENKPARDLVVSPGHAIAFDVVGEVLILASLLVNGSTIVREMGDSVTYWHVELDSHDLLIAEGQPAESYLDMGNRGFFAHARGGAEASGAAVIDLAAWPDADPALRTHADFCRPFHADGPVVAFVRERLEARAVALGWHLSNAQPWAGVHVLADGVRVEPEVRGAAARFVLPAGAQNVWLISPTASPSDLGMSVDGRQLGLNVVEMRLGEGWDTRPVAMDDPLLCAGFHAVEGDAGARRRWTAARARLPAALWAEARLGEDRTFVLHIGADMPALPHWTRPDAAQYGVALEDRSVIAA